MRKHLKNEIPCMSCKAGSRCMEPLLPCRELQIYDSIPSCRKCREKLGRWAWWSNPMEQIEYFYCYGCDEITVHPRRDTKYRIGQDAEQLDCKGDN